MLNWKHRGYDWHQVSTLITSTIDAVVEDCDGDIQYICIKGIGWSYNFELTGSEDGIEQADWLVVVGRAYDRSLR